MSGCVDDRSVQGANKNQAINNSPRNVLPVVQHPSCHANPAAASSARDHAIRIFAGLVSSALLPRLLRFSGHPRLQSVHDGRPAVRFGTPFECQRDLDHCCEFPKRLHGNLERHSPCCWRAHFLRGQPRQYRWYVTRSLPLLLSMMSPMGSLLLSWLKFLSHLLNHRLCVWTNQHA